jgi:hypothetical protein
MKKLLNFLITVALLAALGWVLWRGVTHRHETEHGEAKPEEKAEGEKKEEHEDFVVKLEKEKWKALGLEMAEPLKAELKPQRVAFGRVLDPVPLVALDGELASADAALAASRAEFDRTQALQKSGEGMSRKVAETAEAQFRSDEIKADGLRRRARLEWGAAFPAADAAKRRAFVEQLVGGESALVRVELLPGDALAEQPTGARISVLGRESETIESSVITPASDADPKTQAQGFILRVDKPAFALRPGMALTAWLELPQKVRAGFAVPRAAVLRHDGRAWVFVQEETEKFVRKPVSIETPLDGEKGWFVSGESGGIKGDDLLVVTGAQTLLSEELKAQGGEEKE